MNDRDTFAAAALTGLLAEGDDGHSFSEEAYCRAAYRWADVMLRERANHQAALDGSKNHDAAPAATASAESVAPQPTAHGGSDRADKAAPRPDEGTGDTPSEAEIDALEFVVVNGHTASIGDYGILRQWLIRLRPEFDSPEPIADCDTDSPEPIAEAAKTNPTQPRNGTPEECSVPSEGSVPDSRIWNEPVAWWLKGCEYDTGCEYEYVSLVKESADEAAKEGGTVTPLYRSPTLTDAEREAVEWFATFGNSHLAPLSNNWINHAATLRGLLERLR